MSVRFNPIYGQEELIKLQNREAGSLYFSTDTGHIYLDTDTERIIMGGSGAAVLYASAENVVEYTNDTYGISRDDLEDDSTLPKRGDLIINKDGRFFKVNTYSESTNELNCLLIAVSGSGGGPVGPGPSDPTDERYINVTYKNLKYSFLYSDAQYYTIDFIPIATLDAGKNGLNVSYTVRNNRNSIVDTGSISVTSGDLVSLPVGKNMTPDGGLHAVDIEIRGANSYVYTNTIKKIRCVDLKIETDTDNFISQQIYVASFNYLVKIYGLIDKQLKAYVDDNIEVVLNNAYSPAAESDVQKTIKIDCEKLGLEPGVHTITAYLVADGVPSNIVVTDFIYHPAGTEDATYVIITRYPERCWSYETPEIEYWVYDTSKPEGAENTIIRSVNNTNLDPVFEIQKPQTVLKWSVTGMESNADNHCKITCGSASREVIIYCDHSAIFDQIEDNAILLLNADGRTNSTSLEQRSMWSYTNYKNQTISAELKNFNWYNNGWFSDKNGRGCLRVSNGASVEIPLNLFTSTTPSYGGFTLEFEFNPYNIYSYNLLQQSVNTVEDSMGGDDKVDIIRTFNTEYGAIKYLGIANDGSDFGFCCGTQDAFFRLSNGDHATVRYINDKVVNVAVTINAATNQICMYVNGIMSGMSKYKSSAEFPIYADKIIINSDQCDLDLYNIRIYDQPLSSQNVVQNYIASKKDMGIYSANQFASGATVTLSDLIAYNAEHPTNTTIPYIIFKTKEAPDVLPFNKDNADILCDIKFVNPALDYALTTGVINEAFYKKHAPSFIATEVPINVQGTSSQKYPRKNFKGKFKKAASWECAHELVEEPTLSKFYMRDNIAEKTFTWKADYMDSSSAHNTGFVSYVQDLYWNHPLDYYEGTAVPVGNTTRGEYWQKYRTSLFGFPVLAFHEKSDGSAEFIGRYNFNLDKGADDTLGMTVEKQHPYVSGTFTEEKDDGSTVEKPIDYAHICECWEMANNMGGRCSYRGNPFDYGYDYDKKQYIAIDPGTGSIIESHSDLGDDIEVRYHIDGDAIEGAWLNLDKPLKDGGVDIGSEAAFNVLLGGNKDGTGRTGAYRHLEKFYKWINECFYAFDLNKKEDVDWVIELLGRPLEINEDGSLTEDELNASIPGSYGELIKNRKDKFEAEFNKHLNYEYCMVYYIMTELLVQFDSRGKNMMFASWGPMEQNGDYIWFPIYYDVDTQLGVNNSGIPSWEYNVEPTTGFNNAGGAKAFSTSNSLLWMNFHASYVENNPSAIRGQYRLLRGNSLTIAKLNGYYNFDATISNDYCMKGILPISVMNVNQHYKYIEPSISGYIIGINDDGSPKIRTTDAYFYCLQGTRDLHRELFLRNRFNYYDSKWMAQSYNPGATGGTDLFWRANAKPYEEGSPLNSNLIFRIKPALDQYVVIWLDDSGTNVHPIFVKGGDVAEIDLAQYMTSSEYTQQIIHIGGPEMIQEYGNVSLLYLDEFEYTSDNIVKIELGNDNPNYQPDPNFKTSAFDDLNVNKPLLKVFDVTNIAGMSTPLTSIDLQSSIKLEEFKALGTTLNTVDFADGVNLHKLYLPGSMTNLDLRHAGALNKIVYAQDDLYDDDGNQIDTMYIDNIVTLDNQSNKHTNIGRINILGGVLNQYSYELLEKIVEAKKSMMTYIPNNSDGSVNAQTKLALNLENVHWTPYTQLGEGAVYDKDKNYYYAENNSTYTAYGIDNQPITWERDILNGRIYEYVQLPVPMATSLDILDTFINDNKVHFTNITTTVNTELPIITGDMYVNNSEPISEAKIFNVYKQYFPNLNIRAATVEDAKRARFISVINNIETEIDVQRFGNSDVINIVAPSIQSVIPPQHYDCIGWSLSPNGAIISDFSQYQFIDSDEYVFYAVFTKHEYEIQYVNNSPDELDKFTLKFYIPYNDNMEIPDIIPSRSVAESKLEMTQRIVFKGWTQKKDYSGIQQNNSDLLNQIVDPMTCTVDKNYIFYAVFVQESVYSYTPSQEDQYFNFTYISQNDGYEISLNTKYSLKGKVTLPTTYNTKPIIRIAKNGFAQNKHKITHIFWSEQNSSNLVEIDSYAFSATSGIPTLQHFEFPNSVVKINDYAFSNQTYLVISVLPTELVEIGSYAFSSCPSLLITSFEHKISKIGSSAFSSSIGVSTLNFGDSVTEIGDYAFSSYLTPYSSPQGLGLKTITIGRGIQTIGAKAFLSRNSTNPHFETIETIELAVPVDTVEHAPWSATMAKIKWL